jgi:hypothetical protein
VGGGYGGLCLALYYFSKKYNIHINSYSIIDLKEPLVLQKLYLSKLLTETSVEFIDSSTFGAHIEKENMFLVSNYCFSEIPDEFQKKYIQNLFPKVSHGFMAWNFIKTYDFGFSFREEQESPKTDTFNKYIYF